jgi:hypothetical protein
MSYEIMNRQLACRQQAEPTARISEDKICFNAPASDKLKEMKVTHLLFLWDQEEKNLALKPTAAQDERAFKLQRASGSRRHTLLYVHSMLRKIGWNQPDSVVFRLLFSQNGLIELVEIGKIRGPLKGKKKRRRVLERS